MSADALIRALADLHWGAAGALFLVENLAIIGLSLALGRWILARGARRIAAPPPPLSPLEVALTASTLALNTAVTLGGWALWRADIIHFRAEWRPLWILLDVLVLAAVMDFAMYALHRLAHHPLLYPLLHRMHHRFDRPRPLTLFALNPAEAVAFGGLWLAVVAVYDATWAGMSVYLALNVLFGLVGHLGVEPLPARWVGLPVLGLLTTSTFHAGHHDGEHTNFGFYTLIWDRLFGTLAPDYADRFMGLGRRYP